MRYLFLLLVLSGSLLAQNQQISLDQIWGTYEFLPERVEGFNFLNDGKSYTRLEENKVWRYDLASGDRLETLADGGELDLEIEDYTLSADESKLLLATETEQLFRHSSQSFFYVYDRRNKSLKPVYSDKKHRLASLDPTGERVAFVVDNDVWIRELSDGTLRRVTDDGKINAIINGATDWVYEEEFAFSRAVKWSPDGRRLAYLKFDERRVPEFTYTDFHNALYPEYNTFKYPKVGAENSTVSLHVYDTQDGGTKNLLTVNENNEPGWHYLPRFDWTTDVNELTAQRMNRHQNKLELVLFDLTSGERSTLLKEENKYFINIYDDLIFLRDGERFITTSERGGFNQIYLHRMNGDGDGVAITSTGFDVTDFYGIDEATNTVYFQAAKRNARGREVYRKSLMGRDLPRPVVATDRGTNSAEFSDTYDYFVLTQSDINTPPTVTVYTNEGERVRTIVDNSRLSAKLKDYAFQTPEFMKIETDNGRLDAYLIKPANQVEGQKYPLLVHVYGGPNSQQVLDNWRGQNMVWFQHLAQRGFAVAVVDNRGTGARGEAYQKQTYLQLGKYETEDQIEAAKYLGNLDFIDEERVGIFGWSYGGFMALHAILQGNDVFKAAISVAPVVNWKWYDTIYTERYMRTYEENREGYDNNSPINYADRLKGDLLLVHGMGDDNVHFQHTAEMANALIMANKQFDTYFYPNRNHGIYGGPTRLHLYTKMTDFLTKKLGDRLETDRLRIIPQGERR